tara:strand:+ start:2458 stop:3474 length:1017 start_codon:yes stop_codon:yes gene_type:complete
MKEKGGCKIGLKAPEGSPLGGCKEGLKAKKRIKFKVVDEPKVEPKKKFYVNDPGKAKKKSQQPAQQAKVIAPKPRVAKVAKVIKAKPVKSNTEIVMEARRKVGLGSPGKFEEVSMGYFESATPMNAKFNPVTGNIKTKDNYRMKKLGEWEGEKTFQLERKGNYFVGHGFTVGLLGKGAKDGQGHNIVPALKSNGEKYYAHYSEIGKIDPYIRKFLDPLPKTTSAAEGPSNLSKLEGKLFGVFSRKIYGNHYGPVFKKITQIKDGNIRLVNSDATGEPILNSKTGKPTTTKMTLEKMKSFLNGKEKREAEIIEPLNKDKKHDSWDMSVGGKQITSQFDL